MPIRIAIIGFGKIARDQHVPSIAADPRYELAAISTGSGDPGLGLPWFATATEMYEAMAGRRRSARPVPRPPGSVTPETTTPGQLRTPRALSVLTHRAPEPLTVTVRRAGLPGRKQ